METSALQTDFLTKTVAQMVTEDFRTAEVFKKFGIDFCCGGKQKIEDVCRKKGIDPADLEKALREKLEKSDASAQNFNEWKLDFLADYIVNVHHKYVADNIPLLREFTAKVARVHGEAHSEVVEIARLFEAVASELEQHMMKEENILFPYIKELARAESSGPITSPPFGTVGNPIRMMEMEHENAGNILKKIGELSNGFTPPPDACNTYRVSYLKLREFEMDLHQHIHLENNILFPKAIELESRLLG